MAGNMGLIHPFVFNQFGAYGSYAQVFMTLDLSPVSTWFNLSRLTQLVPLIYWYFDPLKNFVEEIELHTLVALSQLISFSFESEYFVRCF